MALRFFYRRQKLVFIIMVILMVSFLIGFQGFQMIGGSGDKQVVGTTAWGKLRYGDILAAQTDLDILISTRFHFPAQGAEWKTGHAAAFELLVSLNLFDPRTRAFREPKREDWLTYALLLAEARHAGVRVGSGDVDHLLSAFQTPSGQQLLAASRQHEVSEKRLRQAVLGWLMISGNARAATHAGEPSAGELEHTFRDLDEKITLVVARLEARDFVDDIPGPARTAMTQPAVLEKHFEKFRNVNRGSRMDLKLSEAFGFGYRYSLPRADILYASVRGDAVAEALFPGGSMSDDQRTGAKAKADELAKQLSPLLADYAALKDRPADLLQYYDKMGMVRGAADLLNVKVGNVVINDVPLKDAVRVLAAKTEGKVSAVILPERLDWLDASAKVTLVETGITVRDALEGLIRAAATQPASKPASRPKLPAWDWVTVKALPGVLFPAGGEIGTSCLPITDPTRTGPLNSMQLSLFHPRLYKGASAAGLPFDEILFFPAAREGEKGRLDPGQAGETLFSDQTVTVWRLVQFLDPQSPKELTDDLRRQVAEDLEAQKAFDLAWDYAKGIQGKAEARDAGLLAVTRDDKKVKKVFDTEPLSRKVNVYEWNFIYDPQDAQISDADKERWRQEIPDEKQRENFINRMSREKLAGLIGAIPNEYRRQVMEAVFALAPKNIEPPYPTLPVGVAVIPIAPQREVLVVQRIGYQPPVEPEYKAARGDLAAALNAIRRQQAAMIWFHPDNVQKRAGYVEKAKKQ